MALRTANGGLDECQVGWTDSIPRQAVNPLTRAIRREPITAFADGIDIELLQYLSGDAEMLSRSAIARWRLVASFGSSEAA